MAVAQEAQERHSNTRRLVGDEFRLGDRVWLKLKHVKTTRPIKKLIGLPFPIEYLLVLVHMLFNLIHHQEYILYFI